MRENDLLSFAVNWKDDVHREKVRRTPLTIAMKIVRSLASEYQWAAADNVDVVAGISYDWRDSVEAKNTRKMAASPIMTTTISQLLTGR